MERKLASVQVIFALTPIPGADFIEVAHVLGWECVVKKGEFSQGQKCVYIEVDSIVPDTPDFEFMKDRHFKVKTIKLRKQISQGLVMPMSILDCEDKYNVGDDVTKELLITKHDPDAAKNLNATKSKGGLCPFPAGIPKTDEIRIQTVPEVLEELRGKPYYISQKQDGCSATYAFDLEGNFYVCSRNFSIPEFSKRKRTWRQRLFSLPWRPLSKYDLIPNDNVYWQIEHKYHIKEALSKNHRFVIQGEICSPGLQKNRLCLAEPEFYVFNVYNRYDEEYLSMAEAQDATCFLGLKFVPVLEVGDKFDYTQTELLEKAKGFYPETKNCREGIVIRPQEETYSKVLRGRMSFKVVNNDYLLKEAKDE